MVEDGTTFKTIQELRRTNVRRYIDEHYNGSVARFAEAIRRSRQQVSKLLSDPGKAKSAKMLGSQLARKIESQLNLTAGYFDQDHDALSVSALVKDLEKLSDRDRLTVTNLVRSFLDRPGE